MRLGEQIPRTQGIEVVSVTDGARALRRLEDVNPDLLIVDVYLAHQKWVRIRRASCGRKKLPPYSDDLRRRARDEFNEQDAKNAGADVIFRKPFEASLLLGAVQELLEGRGAQAGSRRNGDQGACDRSTVRAAVTLALDSAMPAMIEELTERVLLALSHRRVATKTPVLSGRRLKS